MAKLSKKHAVFLLFAPFVCSKPAIDSGSGDSADIDLFEASGGTEITDISDNFFFDDDDDSAQNLDEESFFDNEEDKELVKSFKSSPNETEKNFFQGTGKAVNIEKAIWNAPMLANTKDFLSNSAILTHVKKNRNLYSTIFANTLLPSKYSLLGDGIFIMNGETALNDELQRNYEMAYKQSSLASFGDNLDTVRPFLAYALGISWNIEFYEINQPLLDKRRKIQGDVQVDIIKDEKYKITDAAKEYFGNIYSKGQDSEVSSRLRLVEFNFEQFVVDVRVWCVRSLGSAYEVVKNVQRAMRSVIKQDEYMDHASKLSPTDPQRIDMLQAVIAKRGNMAQALAKTLPILDGLMTEVETLEYSMERGIRSVLKDAQVKTKEEVKIARDQDRDHRLTNSSIFRQLKKTNQWLSTNENKMRVTEQKINQIAVDIDRKLEDKRDAHQRFQDDLKKANAEIAENEEERLEVFKKFNEDIMKFHEHLKKKQEESHCKIDLSKQITGLVTGCQRSSTTYRTNYYSSCSWFLWFCYRRSYGSYRTYYTHSWTDQTCANNARAEMRRKADLYWKGEENRCKALLTVFEKEMDSFNMKMQKRREIFDKRTAQIDKKNKEIEQAKEKYEAFMEAKFEDIQREKETLLEKRTQLLIDEHNQIKAGELGQLFKSELEDNLLEFSGYTDTLLLTKMSLKEVDDALRRISENLGSFKVGLKVFEQLIIGQIRDFETIKNQVDNCAGQGFRGEECFEITSTFLARDHLKEIQVETLQAGMGSVVLARMYNALYSYLTSLKKYPVGLYDPELGVRGNIKKFRDFVKIMNANSDRISKIGRVDEELENINHFREKKGLSAMSASSNIRNTIGLNDAVYG